MGAFQSQDHIRLGAGRQVQRSLLVADALVPFLAHVVRHDDDSVVAFEQADVGRADAEVAGRLQFPERQRAVIEADEQRVDGRILRERVGAVERGGNRRRMLALPGRFAKLVAFSRRLPMPPQQVSGSLSALPRQEDHRWRICLSST